MASPGMMQSGLSRELFEMWCTDSKNGVIIAGYCVEGTLAKQILSEPAEVTLMSGLKVPLKMSVDYISFSAHTDYEQTSDFIRTLKPPHVVSISHYYNYVQCTANIASSSWNLVRIKFHEFLCMFLDTCAWRSK